MDSLNIIEFEDVSSGREYVAMYNSKRISDKEAQRYLLDVYPLGQHPCIVVMTKKQFQNLGFSENATAEKSNAAGNEPSPVYAHWINPSKNPEYVNSDFFSDCSRCGHTSSEEEPVCPNCGAIMEDPSDVSDGAIETGRKNLIAKAEKEVLNQNPRDEHTYERNVCEQLWMNLKDKFANTPEALVIRHSNRGLTSRNIACIREMLLAIAEGDVNRYWHELHDFIENYDDEHDITVDEACLFAEFHEFGQSLFLSDPC